ERVADDLEERDRRRRLVDGRTLRALVRRGDLEPAVTVQIGEKYTNERAAIACDGRNQSLPVAAARAGAARILEIDEVCELAGDDHVEIAVAVEVADRDVLGGRR